MMKRWNNWDLRYFEGGMEVVGTADHHYGNKMETCAVYGWSKNGTSFMFYSVANGQIQKIGTMKRVDLDVLMATA